MALSLLLLCSCWLDLLLTVDEAAEEKTEFDVILHQAGASKLQL